MKAKTMYNIMYIISIIFAGAVWLLFLGATIVIGSVIIPEPDVRDFMSILLIGGLFYIIPAAGIFYSLKRYLTKQIFWYSIKPGVPKTTGKETLVLHIHM